MVELSKGRQKDIKRHYNVSTLRLGDMIAGSYTCDPAWIISSYRIMGLNAKENTVTATVEYEVLGKFGKRSETGCATEFIAQDVKLLKEQLKFHYSTGKNGMQWVRGTAWYVEDPPQPKISCGAMLRLCKQKVEEFEAIAKRMRKEGKPVLSNITHGIETYEKKVSVLQKLATKETRDPQPQPGP